jgi:hypothetical protein
MLKRVQKKRRRRRIIPVGSIVKKQGQINLIIKTILLGFLVSILKILVTIIEIIRKQ